MIGLFIVILREIFIIIYYSNIHISVYPLLILILVFSESMCYRGEVYQYLSMKSLLLHTEHNAVKRVLSLMLILSFEFSAFAHAGILAIMPVEKRMRRSRMADACARRPSSRVAPIRRPR